MPYKHIVVSTLRALSNDGQGGDAAIAVHALNHMIRIVKPISVRPILLDRWQGQAR